MKAFNIDDLFVEPGEESTTLRIGGKEAVLSPREVDDLRRQLKPAGAQAIAGRIARDLLAERKAAQQADDETPAKPRYQSALSPTAKKLLRERSGGGCEAGLPGCTRRAVDPHHRKTSKSGGRHGVAKLLHDQLSNIVHVCRSCHIKVTDPVGAARDEYEVRGLILLEYQDPERVRVFLPRIGWQFLTTDGQYSTVPPGEVA